VTKERKVFFLYCFVAAILVIIGFSLRYIYQVKEYYFVVARIYVIVEYAFLSYLYALYIKHAVLKKILLYSSVPFAVFAIFDFILSKEPTLPFIPLIVEYILLLFFIICFFFEVMQETVIEPVYHRAIFWVSVAFIVNFSGNFFLFIYSKNSFNNETFQRQYTIIYSTVTILKNTLLCIGVMRREKKDNNTLSNSSLSHFDSFSSLGNLNQ